MFLLSLSQNTASLPAHLRLEQEKMRQDMAVLQRVLEQKERKMSELMMNTGQVPALKQHYDRVLQVGGGGKGGKGRSTRCIPVIKKSLDRNLWVSSMVAGRSKARCRCCNENSP